uniref:VPS13 domain-containing protein n=1 Tax=Heterorhabditis bacteriophora TaxID=37862 RepID=A0A1I7WFV3_HETBA
MLSDYNLYLVISLEKRGRILVDSLRHAINWKREHLELTQLYDQEIAEMYTNLTAFLIKPSGPHTSTRVMSSAGGIKSAEMWPRKPLHEATIASVLFLFQQLTLSHLSYYPSKNGSQRRLRDHLPQVYLLKRSM